MHPHFPVLKMKHMPATLTFPTSQTSVQQELPPKSLYAGQQTAGSSFWLLPTWDELEMMAWRQNTLYTTANTLNYLVLAFSVVSVAVPLDEMNFKKSGASVYER